MGWWEVRSPDRMASQCRRERGRGNIPQCLVRPRVIVLVSPAIRQCSCFAEIGEQFYIQQIITQPIVKALGTVVLPRALRIDEQLSTVVNGTKPLQHILYTGVHSFASACVVVL